MATEKLQATNITEEGKVLYLDQERLDRKVKGYTEFHNYRNGLGIFNFIKEHVSARDWNWKLVLALFRTILNASALMKKDDWKSKLYKRVMLFEPDHEKNTTGIVMPLTIDEVNLGEPVTVKQVEPAVPRKMKVDITPPSEKVVVPVDLIKKALRKAEFIGAMKTCLCRDAQNCQNYPHDVACFFLGDGGRVVVEHGMAVQVTYEEALERVNKAIDLGLVGQSLWVEIEQLIWGFRNDQMNKFIEICFCCPCCCVGMNLSRNAPKSIKTRFHATGFTAVPDRTKCTGCGTCLEVNCPQDALRMGEDGKITVDQECCIGCGICREKCAFDVLKIKQTMPMRESMQDYFKTDFSLPLEFDT